MNSTRIAAFRHRPWRCRLFFGHQIDLPAGQLRSEPHVLAAATDGDGQVVLATTTSMLCASSSTTMLATSAGASAPIDELRRICRPQDDVDALAAQFVGHRLTREPRMPTQVPSDRRADHST
jgi:hypothetical protein